MHIKQIYLYAVIGCIFILFTACSNENDDDFDGVGRLISSRNAARYKNAEKSNRKIIKKPLKPLVENQQKAPAEKRQKTKSKKKKFSSEIFYEEEIKIISASSDTTLGSGTAYLNKDGKIVQIKIKRN